MAKAGFIATYHKSGTDAVRCVFCNVKVWQWRKNDNPMKIHKKMSPVCPFILKTDVMNIKARLWEIAPDIDQGEIKIIKIVSKKEEEMEDDKSQWNDIETREKTFHKYDKIKYLVFEGLFIVEKRKPSRT